ncbi:MAG: hypothetical protein IH991_11635 [Planctomycetes bacterium]|nr:hypothetical protein [Planctomycetota bacterium]
MRTLSLFVGAFLVCFGYSSGHAADPVAPKAADTEKKPKAQPHAELAVLQTRVKNRYEQIERLLFKLMELEMQVNPQRADLLKRAYDQSRSRLTTLQMQKVIERLARKEFDLALEGQGTALKDLNDLLELLKLEDPAERLKSEKQRIKEYIKQVERLIRLEKHLRSQNENGLDADRIAKAQGQVADRAKALDDRIKKDNAPSGSPNGQGDPSKGDGRQGESQGDKQDPKQEKPDGGENPEPSDGKGSDGKGSDGEGSDGKGDAGSGPSGDMGKGGGGKGQDQQQENPVRKRIQAAEKKMREAKRKLEEAKRKESIADQQKAQDELEQAKKELEEILRQLREKEVERMLAMLQARFEEMLKRETAVYEATLLLDKQPADRRNSEFNIQAGRQAFEQRSIAEFADRTFNMLVEEGSSIAFPETVKQMAADMKQVAERLARVKVGPLTQEIEEEIIETLEYLIEALEEEQNMNEENPPGPPPPPGPNGEPPLVDQLAELKMIRGLQERVYKRHTRYSRLLDDPEDIIGQVEAPELKQALDRLSQRQKQIFQITRDIVLGKNQ